MTTSPIRLTFDGGTLVVTGAHEELRDRLPGVRFDPRKRTDRAPAKHYRGVVEHLRAQKIPYEDAARSYQPTPWKAKSERTPFPHQTEAVEAWWRERGQGLVVLPTGTGKTFVAILAIERAGRPAIVVTPTIDLLNQWYGELVAAFGEPIGLIGGGHYDLQPITVSTYDSAYLYVERWGNRYGLLVFDECHHLPGPSLMTIALGSLAPFRLGLTAPPERPDGQDEVMSDLVGPIVYRRESQELAGSYLASYQVERVYVELSPDEQVRYQRAREHYRQFLQQRGISISAPQGWQRFIAEGYRSAEGQAAYQAY